MRTAKQHLLLGFICTVVFFILFMNPLDFWVYFKIFFIWSYASVGADFDKSYGLQHRHLLTHSIVLPVAFWMAFFELKVAIVIWIWSFHLLSDIFQERGKQPKLGFLLHAFKHTFTAKQTRFLLFLNGVVGIVLSIYLEMVL